MSLSQTGCRLNGCVFILYILNLNSVYQKYMFVPGFTVEIQFFKSCCMSSTFYYNVVYHLICPLHSLTWFVKIKLRYKLCIILSKPHLGIRVYPTVTFKGCSMAQMIGALQLGGSRSSKLTYTHNFRPNSCGSFSDNL